MLKAFIPLSIRNKRNKLNYLLGRSTPHWCRVVMDKETSSFVQSLKVHELDVLEVSGNRWKSLPFKTYQSVQFPDYDFCEAPFGTSRWDTIIAEQVLEHLLKPQQAVKHAYQMLRPGGWFIVTTPFLIRIHPAPIDCSRWTEIGLKALFMGGGFLEENIQTGSWGNRACLIANLERWVKYKPLIHTLKNDPRYPIVVWGFAQKSS